MENEVMVSAYCLAYNHEKYIRDALEGFVNQKTNFKYEVIVHDDASTDHTAEIIAEYAAKYPDIIKPIFEEENQYSKDVRIGRDLLFPQMKGKYIAICEGDDYWCDANKLQRQVDFLEAYADYSACVHNTEELDCISGGKRALYDTKADHDVTFAEAMEHGGAAFHTSSVLCRREYCFPPEGLSAEHFGDYPRAVYLCLSGKVHRFKEIMSVYRLFAAGSWTSQNLNTVSQEKQTRTQLWTTEFTTKVYQYCQVTGQSPEITAAAKAVADRDWLRLAVMQRGGGCLLADPALRHDFLQLNAEKKQYILREVWDSWLRKTREKRKKA